MKRTNQGGSILGFVIIGAVMALLLVGGAYVVRHTLKPNDTDRTPVSRQDTDSSQAEKKDTTVAPKDDTKDTPQDVDKDTTPAPSQPDTTPHHLDDTAQDTHTLPTTGPSDALASGVLISSLVGVIAMYVRSRRASL